MFIHLDVSRLSGNLHMPYDTPLWAILQRK